MPASVPTQAEFDALVTRVAAAEAAITALKAADTALKAADTALAARVTKLEGGVVTLPPPGTFAVTAFTPPTGAKVGSPVTLTATLKNGTAASIPAVGIGFYLANGTQVAWASTSTALAPNATVTLDTATAAFTSVWTPSTAGAIVVTARPGTAGIDATTGTLSATVNVAAATTTPPPAGSVPFKASSSWNTKLPATTTFTDRPELRNGGWWFNAGDYGLPLVRSSASDPVVSVQCPGSWGWPAQTLSVRIPASGVGAAGTDGTMTLIDGTTAYDFWQFKRNGNTASCSSWAKSDIVNGSGWGQANPFLAAGIHATGSACLAGLIVGNELRTGINHAISIALRFDLAAPTFVGEAIHSDGGGPATAIPEGARLAIPPTTPMPAGVTSVMGKNLWKALVEYGAFVVDVMGGATIGAPVADLNTVPIEDVNVLLGPNWTAAELTAVFSALKQVK